MTEILAIDDDREILAVIKKALLREGYQVTALEDPLQLEEDKLGRYQLILLDVMMPGIDGFDLCRRIREKVDIGNNRQLIDKRMLNSIGDIQTIITCTGLEEFVNNRFEINRVFKVSAGTVTCVNENMGLKSEPEETPEDAYNFGSL